MPPRVCWAHVNRDNCENTASKKMPSFISFAIDRNLIRSRNTNPRQPLTTADYSCDSERRDRRAGLLRLCFVTPGWKNYVTKCTRTPVKSEDGGPVKISLAGISKFYGLDTSTLCGEIAFLVRARSANQPSPAIRYPR